MKEINTTCGYPHQTRTSHYRRVTIAFLVITSFCVGVRFARTVYMWDGMPFDDALCLVAYLGSIALGVINLKGLAPNGLGAHIWTLTFHQITNSYKWIYGATVIYIAEVGLQKLIMIAFYLRIFPIKPVRRVLWGTAAFILAFTLAYLFYSLFQCHPINHFWNGWDGEHKGYCLVSVGPIMSHTVINTALDLWVIIIPLFQLSRLQMRLRTKLAAGLMFAVGGSYEAFIPFFFFFFLF